MRCNKCLAERTEHAFYQSNKSTCKECIKAAARQHRLENIDKYRAYDKARSDDPSRVKARQAYAKTPEGRLSHARSAKKWAVSNAIRRKANVAVGNAIRDGKLTPQPCFVCGEKAHAHHPDYSRPLDVTWLCPAHHKAAHRIAANDNSAAGAQRA